MNKADVMKLIYVVKSAYPRDFEKFTEKDISNMAAAWGLTLGDMDYHRASEGLKVYLRSDTRGFPPSPGQVLNCAITASEHGGENDISEMEAWAAYKKALSNSGEIGRARKEFAKLPPIVQATVGRPENLVEAALDEELNLQVEQSNFYNRLRNTRIDVKTDMQINAAVTSRRLEAAPYEPEMIEAVEASVREEMSGRVKEKMEELMEMLKGDSGR